jgi:tetratricopeptide (TPR) repeat protein
MGISIWVAAAVLAAPAVPAAAPAGQTVQQQFDAASAALEKPDWAEAARLYEALEARLGSGSPAAARSRAIVRVRKAHALIALHRWDEAETALRQGLAALPANDASVREDRALGLLDLAGLAERSLDYAEALKDYRAAEPMLTGSYQVRALRGIIQTGMFYDAPQALADAERGIALAAQDPANKPREAVFRTLRGRVLLNLGRTADARQDFERAVTLLGGLTAKVDVNDLAARSDAAIAARLAGDQEEARKYLAWTGAGHFDEPFPAAIDMTPPPCGEDLKPDDVAVIELSIAADGTVADAAPIYASHQGMSALLFARAASEWSWRPDELEKIPAIFRTMTRLEMRCSTAARHPGVAELLRPEVDEWLQQQHVEPLDTGDVAQAARLKPLQAELARREAASGPASVALLPVLVDLARNPLVDMDDTRTDLDRAFAIATSARAPGPVIAFVGIRRAVAVDWRDRRSGTAAQALRTLLADPRIASDPRAAAAVRLALAAQLAGHKAGRADAMAVLDEATKTPGLPAQDPMRAAAFARLASLKLANGEVEAARATYAASGLSADQCALLDATPRLKHNAGSSGDFPQEAMRWGFEGWAKLEYDLTAAGVTTNVRPTVAYPPFIFGKAGSEIVQRLRYDASFRPDGSLGCGGMAQSIHFRLGH